ncbi:Short chain dehydrogenase [Spraguea lophii 42_110]|uniref:Short chain dehydrogenase n=1 Tax=Spraguea lophii (strain 42_110) TaxID=1358809 RepID=S7XJJ0_SPRLO|nr:Short chain dehydrogenase [Spraguea lophii 42_110]
MIVSLKNMCKSINLYYVVIFYLLLFLLLVFIPQRKQKNFIEGNQILIIGGSTGLGISLAIQLQDMGCKVYIAGRNLEKLKHLQKIHGFNFYVLDVRDINTLKVITEKFNYVFYCAGYCVPGYFIDLKIEDFKQMMDTNFFGCINTLKYLLHANKTPFSYIAIASTVCYYTFPGYSGYSPSKAALKSFFDAAELELEKKNIKSYIYFVNTIDSLGFKNENKTKPEFTKYVEGEATEKSNPDIRASVLIKSLKDERTKIVKDFETQILKVAPSIDYFSEIIYLPLAIIILPVWNYYIRKLFLNHHQ